MATRNKVHFGVFKTVSSVKARYAACGADSHGNRRNVIPTSKEWRDVNCKNCLRIKPKK